MKHKNKYLKPLILFDRDTKTVTAENFDGFHLASIKDMVLAIAQHDEYPGKTIDLIDEGYTVDDRGVEHYSASYVVVEKGVR